MTRLPTLILLLPVSLLLGGCAAAVVASAVGAAAGGTGGQPRNKSFMQAAARQACTGHATQYGAVQITAVQQATVDRIVVRGTVQDGGGALAFDCTFETTVTDFKLRPVSPRS